MKILYVITGLGIGGAERMVVDLATSIAKDGTEVIICYLKGKVHIKNIPKNIHLECSNFDKGLFIGFINLLRLIKKHKPRIVHSHMIHANILTRVARLFTSIPILVSTAHNKNEGGWLRMRGYQLTNFLTDLTTNVSQEAVDEFIRLKAASKSKIIPIYNGIDTIKFRPDEKSRIEYRNFYGISNEKLFLAVGRLVEAKDYPNMLHAISNVYKKENNIKLFIVGDGPLKSNLENLVVDLGIEKVVSFLGIRHDIEKLMNAADYFLLSSAWEGFGLVVAEAMATEKIVIATDSGGVKEVIGECGFLVPPKNHIFLSNSIMKAIQNSSAESVRLRRNARIRIVEKFSLEKTKESYLNIYKNLLKEKDYIN